MTPSEIGFLALGLLLGTTAGAVLLAVVRPRSPLRPVVKVTVTPHALAPRSRDAGAAAAGGRVRVTVPGSPDDDAQQDGLDVLAMPTAATAQRVPEAPIARTHVPSAPVELPASAVGIPIAGTPRPAVGPLASVAPAVALAARPLAAPHDPLEVRLPARVDVGPSRDGLAVRARPPAPQPRPGLGAAPIGIPVVAGGLSARRADGESAVGNASADPCGEARRAASDACAVADASRDTARSLADRLRNAQRAHADLQARVEEAGALADPRRLAAEKDRLHERFQTVHGRATTAEEAEAAARDWLSAVSAANTAAQDAARRIQTATEELRSQAVALERLDLEANVARIAAARTEAACRAARETLAACEERERVPPAAQGEPGSPLDVHWPGTGEPGLEREPATAEPGGGGPVILRVLRGDAGARERLVASLAAGDPAAVADWHVRIARFVDAVTARAIEEGYLDTDEDNPFWRRFAADEQRAIIGALAALGYRFDGLRGFTDGRVPTARDLSLAVGYAGLDGMRIRTWPGDEGLAALFSGTVVRADVWLASQADDLSLARVEAAIGARSAGLAELWDAWGRVRPAMLEER